MTYSELSAAVRANPSDQKLAGQAKTMFEGETLRGLLLSAWAWSVVGRLTGLGTYVVLAVALLLGVAMTVRILRTRIPVAV